MSSQRSSVRATSPDQPKAPAKAKGKSKKQQRDPQNSDIEDQSPECAEDKGAPKRGSRKRESKKEKDSRDCESEDKPLETPAPKRGSIIRQSKKQRDPSNRDCESLESSESKSEENTSVTSRSASVHNNANNANNAGENDRQDSAKSKRQSKKKTNPHDCESEDKPQQTAKSKSGDKTGPKRQSKKQRDPSNLDREQSLESSKSKPEEKSAAKPRRLHGSAAEADFIGARNTQDAPRNKKSAEKTATRGLSVDDTLGKILKETIEKLKIKKFERSNASSCVNAITDKVIAHLKQNTTWCADIESLRTGSYYENLKVSVAV